MKTGNKKYLFLEGINILDLSPGGTGLCSKVLSDLGASVIRVKTTDMQLSEGSSCALLSRYLHSNKLHTSIDIELPEGAASFKNLVNHSDVLVETYPPGHLKALALDYDRLKKSNPGLIMVSITGFGPDDPRSVNVTWDLPASACGGSVSVNGLPSREPIKPYGSQSSYVASLFAAIGILLALRKRKLTGKGEHLDISAQESVASSLDHVLVRYFHEGVIPRREGRSYWNRFFHILPCKDGHIHMTLSYQWNTLVELLDSEGMAGDLLGKEYQDETYRMEHVDHIIDLFGRWTLKHEKDELFQMGQLMRFPWAPVNSPEEVMNSPQLKARGFFRTFVHDERKNELICPGIPYRFSEQTVEREERFTSGAEIDPGNLKKKSEIKKGKPGFRNKNNPLEGIRILDFTRVLAGPFATRMLADKGSEVIKVQSGKTATGSEDNQTGYFCQWNRNKRSITIDMGRPEAKEVILRLTALSDVIVENFSPRVMENWELGYDRLIREKPDLIMLSMSGMGRTGPWKDFVAFGQTIQSLSGMTWLTSYDKDDPMGLGYSYADHVAGLYGTIAVLAALEYRDRTGKGLFIDLSEYESMCTLMVPALITGAEKERYSFPPFPDTVYPCRGKDKWSVIGILNNAQGNMVRRVIENSDSTEGTIPDKRDETKAIDNQLRKSLAEWTSKRSREEVVSIMQRAGIPAGSVQDAQDLVKDPGLVKRGFFVHLDHPEQGDIIADRTPIRLGKGVEETWKPAPILGEANEYVFMELLGFSEEKYTDYIKKGIIS